MSNDFFQKILNKENFNCKIEEVDHDLFCDYFNKTFHLVHCVSYDLAMRKGITLSFVEKYDNINELKKK